MEARGEHEGFVGKDGIKIIDKLIDIQFSSSSDANDLNALSFQRRSFVQGVVLVRSFAICNNDDHFRNTISVLPVSSEYLRDKSEIFSCMYLLIHFSLFKRTFLSKSGIIDEMRSKNLFCVPPRIMLFYDDYLDKTVRYLPNCLWGGGRLSGCAPRIERWRRFTHLD